MPKIEYEGEIYDSTEELEFKHWLDEAYEAGLIEGYSKCEKGKDTIELIGKQHYWAPTKTNGFKKKHCFASVNYTPDFTVEADGIPLFIEKDMGEHTHYIDVKASFSKHNDTKQFQLIRKMMFQFKGIYVHKVVPEKLFLKTWLPKKAGRTAVKGDIQKKYADCLTIDDYRREYEERVYTN